MVQFGLGLKATFADIFLVPPVFEKKDYKIVC